MLPPHARLTSTFYQHQELTRKHNDQTRLLQQSLEDTQRERAAQAQALIAAEQKHQEQAQEALRLQQDLECKSQQLQQQALTHFEELQVR